ncbi:MAG: hypothetical protein IT581_14945 [Verrucomicrobiales bacterium]|nr:hypothetical protein [Verrucomicrobiales bacterium]
MDLAPARWTRWLVWGGAGILLLWFLYAVVLNAALRSSTVRRWINGKPEKFFIDWKSASSWLPGVFHVQGLYFVGQGSSCTYYGRMDDARFRVRLLSLLNQVVHAADFDGAGIEFQLRRPTPPGTEPSAESAFYPPIPGLETLPRRTAPRSPPGKPSWWIRVDDVRFREIDQVWLYGTRLLGPATLQAKLDMQVEGPFRLALADLRFPSAVLKHHGAVVGTNLDLRMAGEMGPLVFDVDDVPDEKIFDFISAKLGLTGDLQSVSLLKERLGQQDTIDFGGEGRIDAVVSVERGVMQPSTKLTLKSPGFRVLLGSVSLGGNAWVEDRVEVEDGVSVARLRVELEDFEVKKGVERVGFAPGKALQLTAATRGLKLSEWAKDAEMSIRIRPLTVSNVAAFNEFIPKGAGVTLDRGAMTVEAEYERKPSGGLGRIEFRGEGLAARAQDEIYSTDVQLDVRLAGGDAVTNRFELAGTSLLLTNVGVPGLSRERQEGWHTRVDVDSGRVSWSKERWAVEDARLRIDMRDTRPVKALLVGAPDSPGWLRLMPTIRDLKGQLNLQASPEEFRLNEARLDGRGTEVRAELTNSAGVTRGVVYARYGILSAGFDLRSAERRWRLLGAKRWYQRVSAAPWEPPGQEAPEETESPDAEGDDDDPGEKR